MNDNDTVPRPARLKRALARGFRDAYDNLGYVVLSSFVSFLATAAVVGAAAMAARYMGMAPGPARVAAMVPGAFVGWLCAVGVFYVAKMSASHEHPVLSDTWVGVRRLFRPAVGLFALNLIVTLVLVGDVVFFASLFAAGRNPVFMALAVLTFYVSVMWLMTAMYHIPLLAAQLEMESGPSPLTVLRKSFLLAAGNPGFTVGFFVVIIALAVLCVVTVVGMAVLFPGASAFVLTHALRELFIRYGIVEDEPEAVEDKPWRL